MAPASYGGGGVLGIVLTGIVLMGIASVVSAPMDVPGVTLAVDA